MKFIISSFFLIVLSAFIAEVGSIIWWRAWMYDGFYEPPNFLEYFWKCDGEGAYDLMAYNMVLILFVCFLIFFLCLRTYRKRLLSYTK
jgi:hypothetical protein